VKNFGKAIAAFGVSPIGKPHIMNLIGHDAEKY